jgi:hypothetical protein
MRGAIPQLPNTPSWRGAKMKYTDNFTFSLMLNVGDYYVSLMVIPYTGVLVRE